MIIIGVLLVAAALVFGVDLIFQNHHYHVITPTVFGEGLGFHSEAPIFIVGMITGAAIVLGFALVVLGIRHPGVRAGGQRRDRRDVREARDQRDDLGAQNQALRCELEREQAPVPGTVPVT